jgi:hypothetical protein
MRNPEKALLASWLAMNPYAATIIVKIGSLRAFMSMRCPSRKPPEKDGAKSPRSESHRDFSQEKNRAVRHLCS